MEQLLERLAKTNEDLRAALVEGDAIFAEFRQGHTGERYPEQDELVPVLRGFQKIATAFAEFLRVLYEVIHDEDAIATLKRMPPESRGGSYIDTQQLLPFFSTIS
jgi:hypothetical protein